MTEWALAAAKREFVRAGYKCSTEREYLGWYAMALRVQGVIGPGRFCEDCPLVTAKARKASGVCIRVKVPKLRKAA